MGCPKARLAFAGRWVPTESVEDYARESRAAVLRNIEDIMMDGGAREMEVEEVMEEVGKEIEKKGAVPAPPKDTPEPAEGMTQAVIGTTARGKEGKLHFLKPVP